MTQPAIGEKPAYKIIISPNVDFFEQEKEGLNEETGEVIIYANNFMVCTNKIPMEANFIEIHSAYFDGTPVNALGILIWIHGLLQAVYTNEGDYGLAQNNRFRLAIKGLMMVVETHIQKEIDKKEPPKAYPSQFGRSNN